MTTPDPVYTLRGIDRPITALLPLRPFRDQLLVGTQNGGLFVWSLKSRRVVQRLEAHDDAVLCIHVNGEEIVSQGRDGYLREWRLKGDILSPSGVAIPYDAGNFCPLLVTGRFYCVTSSASPGQLALLGRDGRCHGNLVVDESGERKYGMAMVARQPPSDESSLFVGYEDGSVALWETTNFAIVSREKFHDDAVMAMDVSRASRRGISASADNKIRIWTWNEERILESYKTVEITNPGVNSIRIRGDDKLFVLACWDGAVRVYSLKKLTLLAVLTAHKEAIRCLSFDSENFLYVGSDDGTISVWGIYR